MRPVEALRGAPLEELKSGSYHILNSAKRSTGGGRKFGDHINLVLKPLETLGNLWIPSETLTLAEDPTVSLPWKAHTGHRSATKATTLFNCCMMLNAKCHTRICCLHFTTQSPMVSCSKTPPILRQVAALTVETAGLGPHGGYLRLCHGSASPAPEDRDDMG